jgi:regulator of protease activity HflC (stomatin/prohibitin superfamily)
VPGQESRISFDSRLFNFLAQPEQVGHSLADALNYQFGFEVSRTWFYQLLRRYFLPLLVFPVVILLLMSCFVYVHDDQQAVVLRLGQVQTDQEPLGPGLHLKLPWPIDEARYFETGDVKQIILGVNEHQRQEYARNVYTRGGTAKRVLLWKEDHEGETSMLLAQPIREGQARAAAGAALGKVVAEVSFQIRDVYTYGFKYHNPDHVLENLIAAELTEMLASATLMEEPEQIEQVDPNHPRSIMTQGRGAAAKALRRRIETALAEMGGLGIEITHVGLPSVHPPSGAAPAYEEVVNARLAMLIKEYEAEGEASRMLAEVAGDPLVGRLLAQEIDTLQKVAELNRYLSSTPPDLAEFDKAIDSYIHQASQVLEMYRRQIEREKLLGRLKPSRIEEVKAELAAGQASLEDLARAEVNDALVMWLVHQRQQELLEGIRRKQEENQAPGLDEMLAQTERRIYELFEEASGEPAELIATARAERRKLELTERTRAEAFKRRLTAWRASPYMYELDRRLEIIERLIPQLDLENKIVIGIDPEKVQVWSDRRQQGEALSEIPWGKPEENQE